MQHKFYMVQFCTATCNGFKNAIATIIADVVQNHRRPSSDQPQATDHSGTDQRPGTIDHLQNNRPLITDHRPDEPPTTDLKNHRPWP